jgi:hypothetical protein
MHAHGLQDLEGDGLISSHGRSQVQDLGQVQAQVQKGPHQPRHHLEWVVGAVVQGEQK